MLKVVRFSSGSGSQEGEVDPRPAPVLQPTRRREHIRDEYTLLCLLYVSLLGCLAPFLLTDWQVTVDDDYSNTVHGDFWFMALCLSCLTVTIPSAIDTTFDLFYQLSHFLMIAVNKTPASTTTMAPSNVLRMTHVERAGFMLGCASAALVCFLPSSCGSTTQILVFNCTSNCSCILATFQLLKFLNRVTKTFGFWLVLFIYANTCVGAVSSSVSLAYMGREDSLSQELYRTLATVSGDCLSSPPPPHFPFPPHFLSSRVLCTPLIRSLPHNKHP